MDLYNESRLPVRLSCRPAGRFAWQNFNVGHYTQTFQPYFVILAMLTGTDTKDEIYDPVADSL